MKILKRKNAGFNFVKFFVTIITIPSLACSSLNILSGNAVSSLEDVETAVIQIVGQGTFVTPGEGVITNSAGSGSGFIISSSGIAVTNNHVVTGASYLDVYIQGEDTPRSATILGVSECSDLAVIDIDGDGFKYLNWYKGEIEVGLDVYTAGFPLGNPEYTLTRGIISKANANGDTPWASVEHVVEHDATINPGNSGGPLIDDKGKVVGVNFAGSSSTNQYFAIAYDEVLGIVDQLKDGEDVDSIGINGEALTSKIANGFGIWVSSVKAGTPADNAGIKAGDIIYSLADFSLTEVPTLAEYCKVLRSHKPTDTMNIKVIRLSVENGTATLLEGQINGRELEETEVLDLTGGGGAYDVNLLQNPSNEEGMSNGEIPGWTVVSGSGWGIGGDDVPAYDGQYYFDAGQAGTTNADLCQFIDVSTYGKAIDQGKQDFQLDFAVRSFPAQLFVPADGAQALVYFFDENKNDLDALYSDEYFSTGNWDLRSFIITAVPGTRILAVCLRSILYGGYDSDGFFDAVSLIALEP